MQYDQFLNRRMRGCRPFRLEHHPSRYLQYRDNQVGRTDFDPSISLSHYQELRRYE